MTERLRLALFGAGNIGERHLRLAAAHNQCAVVAVADPSDHSKKLAKEFSAQHFSNFKALLAEAKVDGAIIATPNDLHASIALECVKAGIPVLVEKPITDTVSSGEALIEAAEARGVALAVGHHRRFDPVIEIAKNLIDAGELGKLVAVECIWALRKHDSYYEASWRTTRPSGGPALINLIHDLDLLRYLAGDIVKLYAQGGAIGRTHEVEDTLSVSIRFSTGAVGSVIASDATPSPWGWEQGTGENPEVPATGQPCFKLLGTEASLAIPTLELWRHAERTNANWHHPLQSNLIPQSARQSLQNQLTHFCGVVRGDHPPRVSGQDALHTLKAVDGIHQSLASDLPISLV